MTTLLTSLPIQSHHYLLPKSLVLIYTTKTGNSPGMLVSHTHLGSEASICLRYTQNSLITCLFVVFFFETSTNRNKKEKSVLWQLVNIHYHIFFIVTAIWSVAHWPLWSPDESDGTRWIVVEPCTHALCHVYQDFSGPPRCHDIKGRFRGQIICMEKETVCVTSFSPWYMLFSFCNALPQIPDLFLTP